MFIIGALFIIDDEYIDLINRHTEGTTTALPPLVNETIPVKEEEKEKPFSCDHSITLYILNQKYFLESMGPLRTVQEDKAGDCHPPFWASFVPKTNLLLLVVEQGDWVFGEDCPKAENTVPKPTNSSTTSREPCHKLDLGQLPRRRLEGCFTYHDEERNITACGLGTVARADLSVLLVTWLLAALVARFMA